MAHFRGLRRLAAMRSVLLCLAALAGTAGETAAESRQRFSADAPNELVFPAQDARFVRLVIPASATASAPWENGFPSLNPEPAATAHRRRCS